MRRRPSWILKRLYDEGILTKDECEEKKKKYLAIL
jgi:membrane carboxypeptidase/penicillin-binding protein